MKKFITLALAVVTVMSCSMVALASQQQTVLTTTVPEAKYTLQIPSDTEIPFGVEEFCVGEVAIVESSGFLAGKKLSLNVSREGNMQTSGSNPEILNHTIVFGSNKESLLKGNILQLGSFDIDSSEEGVLDKYITSTSNNGEVEYPYLYFFTDKESWQSAKPGEYAVSILFETEIIYE